MDTLSAICEVVGPQTLQPFLPTIALHQVLAGGRVRAHRFAAPRLTRSIAWCTTRAGPSRRRPMRWWR